MPLEPVCADSDVRMRTLGWCAVRPLPLLTRSVSAAAAATIMLFSMSASLLTPPADLESSASVEIWSHTVNEQTEHMRQAVAEFPWAAQSEQLRRYSESQTGDSAAEETDQGTQSPGERVPTPATEPVFVENPSGPVDCAEVRCVALTFDDGPVPNTRPILDALAEVDARASFFMTGQMASTNPGIAADVAAAGHDLGNHGWSHTDFTELSDDELDSELSRTAEAVEAATGIRPSMVRPPYGSLNAQVRQTAELPMIMWSTDSRDWDHRSAAQTHQQVLDKVAPGDIVLLHDLEASTAEAVPLILRDLLAKGYHLVTVSEILGGPGEAGQVHDSGLSP